MKFTIQRLKSEYLIFTIMLGLVFQTLNCAIADNDHNTNSKIVDLQFLKNINELKSQMIKEGSEFKNVALKFISKTNRYVIADENIKVISNLIFFICK